MNNKITQRGHDGVRGRRLKVRFSAELRQTDLLRGRENEFYEVTRRGLSAKDVEEMTEKYKEAMQGYTQIILPKMTEEELAIDAKEAEEINDGIGEKVRSYGATRKDSPVWANGEFDPNECDEAQYGSGGAAVGSELSLYQTLVKKFKKEVIAERQSRRERGETVSLRIGVMPLLNAAEIVELIAGVLRTQASNITVREACRRPRARGARLSSESIEEVPVVVDEITCVVEFAHSHEASYAETILPGYLIRTTSDVKYEIETARELCEEEKDSNEKSPWNDPELQRPLPEGM